MTQLATIDWGAISSLGAIVVGLAALGAAIFEGRATRRHNRLSVRPLLRIDRYENKGITLHNTGSGPAILVDFQVFADDQLIDDPHDTPAVLAAEIVGLDQLLPLSSAGRQGFSTYTPDRGDSLMAQEHFHLLAIQEMPDHNDRSAAYAALLRITFRIRYKSMYGEEEVFDEPHPSLRTDDLSPAAVAAPGS